VYRELLNHFSVLPRESGSLQHCRFDQKAKNEGILTSAQVQYVAAGGNFVWHGYSYNGALRVLEHIMRYDYLWNRVRVQGGAYGAGARFDFNGNTTFNSYRDPNLAETLAVFRELPHYIENFSLDEREMRKYIIGTVSQLDKPLTPLMQLEQAAEYYLRGVSRELLQKERNEVIDCTPARIKALKKLVQAVLSDGYICVLGGEGKVRENKSVFAQVVNVLP
jgi:Zn-dependent M16 (insulinase) family peptidase